MSPPKFSTPAERRDYVLQLRGQGQTFGTIGEELGISSTRARELYLLAERLKKRVPLPPIEDVDDATPVERLPLSPRTRRALVAADVQTFADLRAIDPSALPRFYLMIPNGGRGGLNEILTFLKAHSKLEA